METNSMADEVLDSDLVPVYLPTRHPRLPTMYIAKDHPGHPVGNPGRSYVYYTRPTEARMSELVQAGETINLKDIRLLRLLPGDYLWTRNEFGSRLPKDDALVAWRVGKHLRSKAKMDALDKARNKFMGPEEDITEESVLFERLDPKPTPVKKDTRCWTLGYSIEPNTNIEAPCANGKGIGGATAYNDTAQAVVTASTALAMEDMEYAPEAIKEVLKSEFDRHGMPPLGSSNNWAYHAVQCNLAYAGNPMTAQMGRYAGSHRDDRDCPGHFSTMIVRCKLPPNYVPPCLFLVGIGAYSELEDFDGLSFQGGYDHVGSQPYPREGTPPSPTAYRFALIHYTPQRAAAAETRMRIGAMPTTQAFLSPEMRASKFEKEVIKRLQEDPFANFLRDGVYLMQDDAFASYVGRIIYLVNRYLLLQAHPRFAFELDPEVVARSITYTMKDGTTSTPAPWKMAPHIQEDGPRDQRREDREESEKGFKEHVFKHGSMIPFYFMHSEWIKDEVEQRYGRVVRVDKSGEGEVGARHNTTALATAEGRGAITTEDSIVDKGDVPEESASLRYSLRKRTRGDEDRRETDSDDEDQGNHGTDQSHKLRPAKQRKVELLREIYNTEDHGDLEGGKALELKQRQRGKKPTNQSPEETFKLLRMLSVEVLEDEVLELRKELQAEEDQLTSESEENVDEIKDCIDGANDAIEMGGVGKRAVKGIAIIMGDAPRLSSHLRVEGSRIRDLRRTLIKAQTALRTWIEGPVANEAYETARKGRSGGNRQTWVAALTSSVVDLLVSKRSRKTFKASEYGLDWECEEVELHNAHTGNLMVRGQEDTIREAVAMTLSVVEAWVKVDKHCDRKQAWFASTVEEVLGEEALSTNIVWNLYNNLKSAHIIQGDKGYRNPSKKDVLPFRTALEGHSVLDLDHREGKLFELYKQLYNREISPSDVLKSLPSVSPRWMVINEMIQDSFLYDNDLPHPTPTPYFKKLQSNPNIYHPLRERGPGRRRTRQDLLDGDGAVSVASIFSLLAWRTYPMVFSWHPDSSMLFLSPREFLQAYQRIVKSEPSEGVVKAVTRFWKMLEERRWTKFADTYPTFEECYQYFKPNRPLETRLYPKLSRTNAFDVACDLAYAQFCQPPMSADVARHVVHMNQGAMAGLKALGLVDGKKKDVETKRAQVHQALLDLGVLLKGIPEYAAYEDDTELDAYDGEVDPMGIEHLLRTLSHSMKLL